MRGKARWGMDEEDVAKLNKPPPKRLSNEEKWAKLAHFLRRRFGRKLQIAITKVYDNQYLVTFCGNIKVPEIYTDKILHPMHIKEVKNLCFDMWDLHINGVPECV